LGRKALAKVAIGRALRRQSYDLNAEFLFNVEYADVFGIPFDFTAKPVVAPPLRVPRGLTAISLRHSHPTNMGGRSLPAGRCSHTRTQSARPTWACSRASTP
jgi:hypothetical protein